MHKKYLYSSVFAPLINDYIAAHREAGFMYDTPAYWLYRFDQYCDKNLIKEASITKVLYDAWAVKADSTTKTSQCNRLQVLRTFSVYLNTLGIHSYIPTNLPRPEKRVPYLMTDKDIREFFEQADRDKGLWAVKVFQRMAQEYKVVFRLIYCCGLRNNEACTLKTSNIDLASGSITIYHSKGNKDRIVYLSEDMRKLCLDYQQWLNKELDNDTSQWFFPGKRPENHIPKTSLDRKFNEFWNATETSKTCDKKPTVHCLRHAYVIKRVNLWMKEDIPLRVMMPYLSNYLGHKGPIESFYYYHQVEDVFKTVRRKDAFSARVIPEVQHENDEI
jgi:integrase